MKYLLTLTAVIVAVAAAVIPAGGANGMPAQGYRLITDTLGGNGHPKQVQGYRFITDTLAPGGGVSRPTVINSPGNSFSWADAGIGAAAATGALLALIGGFLVTVSRRNPRVAV